MRLDQQRLGQAGHAGDQAMAAAEQRHQHFVDDLVLSDDDLAQFREDFQAAGGDLLGQPFNRNARRVHVAPSVLSESGNRSLR